MNAMGHAPRQERIAELGPFVIGESHSLRRKAPEPAGDAAYGCVEWYRYPAPDNAKAQPEDEALQQKRTRQKRTQQ